MTCPAHKNRLGRGGFALVAVMWVVLVAGLMLLGLQKAVRVNFATAHNELDSVRAHWLARAGVEVTLDVWDEMVHTWQMMAGFLPEGRQAIEDLGGYIAGRLQRGRGRRQVSPRLRE